MDFFALQREYVPFEVQQPSQTEKKQKMRKVELEKQIVGSRVCFPYAFDDAEFCFRIHFCARIVFGASALNAKKKNHG